MATFRHPVTGVVLNQLDVHRKRLNAAERETARQLRRQGHKIHDIAAMLGTNAGRIAPVVMTGPKGKHGDPGLLI